VVNRFALLCRNRKEFLLLFAGEVMCTEQFMDVPIITKDGRRMTLPVIGWTADRKSVISSNSASISGDAMRLLPDALRRIDTENHNFVAEELDFPTEIGVSYVVETGPGDDIVFAQRPGVAQLSRMVRGRKPEPCRHLTVKMLKRSEAPRSYRVFFAHVCRMCEMEPGDLHKLRDRNSLHFHPQVSPQGACLLDESRIPLGTDLSFPRLGNDCDARRLGRLQPSSGK
jgi:hypothetical protein